MKIIQDKHFYGSPSIHAVLKQQSYYFINRSSGYRIFWCGHGMGSSLQNVLVLVFKNVAQNESQQGEDHTLVSIHLRKRLIFNKEYSEYTCILKNALFMLRLK